MTTRIDQQNGKRKHPAVIRSIASAAVLALTGCLETTVNIADMTCDDVAREAIQLSGGRLVKIENGKETYRAGDKLTCFGEGIYADSSQIETRYRAYLENNAIMIAFDVDTATRERQREIEQDGRDFENALVQAQRDMNHTSSGDRW